MNIFTNYYDIKILTYNSKDQMHNIQKFHTSSISAMIEDDGIETPKVPRGRRSDLTEKDLEEFVYSFSSVVSAGHLE